MNTLDITRQVLDATRKLTAENCIVMQKHLHGIKTTTGVYWLYDSSTASPRWTRGEIISSSLSLPPPGARPEGTALTRPGRRGSLGGRRARRSAGGDSCSDRRVSREVTMGGGASGDVPGDRRPPGQTQTRRPRADA